MIGFRSKGRFRLSKPFDTATISQRINNVLTSSNKYGLIFAAKTECICIIDTTVVRNHVVTKENFKQDITGFDFKELDLSTPIQWIACNCDGTLLAVVVGSLASPIGYFALIYDVRCFLSQYRQEVQPMCCIRLEACSAGNESILNCFEWNTGISNMFASCFSSGAVMIHQIHGTDKFTVEGAIYTKDPKAVSMSWSPKGKQLVVGFSDCTLCQFKPNLQAAKRIDPVNSSVLGFQEPTILNVCWLSTVQFFVVYADKTNVNRTALCHVTLQKEGPPVYKNFDDICFGSSSLLKPHYYMLHLMEWKFVICISSNSMESSVIGWNPEAKAWEIWIPDDDQRADLPLDSQENETFPVGVCLDLVATEKDSMPLLLIMSTDGKLCPFQFGYRGPHRTESVCKARETNIALNEVQVSKNFAANCRTFFASLEGKTKTGVVPISTTVNQAVLPIPTPATQMGTKVTKTSSSHVEQQQGSIAVNSSDKVTANVQMPSEKVPTEEQQNQAKVALLRQEIIKTVSKYENDVKRLSAVLRQPIARSDAIKEFNRDIIKNVKDSETELNVLSESYNNLSIDSADLSRQVFSLRITLETCHALFQKRSADDERALLRERPLTQAQEMFLNETNERIKNFDLQLDELIGKFNDYLSRALEMSKNKKFEETERIMAYRTLSNMQSIIVAQRQKIGELKKLSNFTSVNGHIKKEQASSSSPSAFSAESTSNHTKAAYQRNDGIQLPTGRHQSQSFRDTTPLSLPAPRDTRLRRFLLARNRVPIRTTMATAEQHASRSMQLLSALKSASTVSIAEATGKVENVRFATELPAAPAALERQQKVTTPVIQTQFSKTPLVDTAKLTQPEKKSPLATASVPVCSPPSLAEQKTFGSSFSAFGKATSNCFGAITLAKPIESNMPKGHFPPTTSSLHGQDKPKEVPTTRDAQVVPTITGQKPAASVKPAFGENEPKQISFNPKVIPAHNMASVTFESKTDQNIHKPNLSTVLPGSATLAASNSTVLQQEMQPTTKAPETVTAETDQKQNALLVLQETLKHASSRSAPLLPIPESATRAEEAEIKDQSATQVVSAVQDQKLSKIEQGRDVSVKSAVSAVPAIDLSVSPAKTAQEATQMHPISTVDATRILEKAEEKEPAKELVKNVVPVTTTEASFVALNDNKNILKTDSKVENSSTAQVATNNESVADMEADILKQDQTLANFSFNICTPSTTPQLAGATGSIFGGLGLGGSPKPESANKNIFGSVSFGQQSSTGNSPFGSALGAASSASPFGSLGVTGSNTGFGSPIFNKESGGSFSTPSGSVAQQGFGTLGSSPSSNTGSIFGGSTAFGGAPLFGSKSAFGASAVSQGVSPTGSGFGGGATFGGSPTFTGVQSGSSIFGGTGFPTSTSAFGAGSSSGGGFAAFAKASAPTFGSLAGVGGSSPQQQTGSVFGGGPTNIFGASVKPATSGAPAFSQWR